MSAGAFSDDSVVSASEKLVRILVDNGKDGKLFDKYGVKSMPTVKFLDPDGKEVGKMSANRADGVAREFLQIAEKHSRGPKWLESGEKAFEAGKADSKPVLLVFADEKPKSVQFLKSFGDAAFKDLFEKFSVAKMPFAKDSEDCKTWKVTEAPTTLVLDVRGDAPAVLKTIKGVKSPKSLKTELEDALKKASAHGK